MDSLVHSLINWRKKILTCDLWIMIYIVHQEDKAPIRIQSKNLACGAFFLIRFACGAVQRRSLFTKKSCLQHFYFLQKSCPWAISFQCLLWFTDSVVLKIIRIQKLSYHNDTVCEKHWWRKCQITNPLSDQTSWHTNRTTLIQFRNSL